MFGLFFKNIHPIMNLFKRFDMEYKRLVRFAVVSI